MSDLFVNETFVIMTNVSWLVTRDTKKNFLNFSHDYVIDFCNFLFTLVCSRRKKISRERIFVIFPNWGKRCFQMSSWLRKNIFRNVTQKPSFYRCYKNCYETPEYCFHNESIFITRVQWNKCEKSGKTRGRDDPKCRLCLTELLFLNIKFSE